VLICLALLLIIGRISVYAWIDRAPSLSSPAGFTSGTTQAPATGTWYGTGTTTGSEGYSDEAVGSSVQRVWTITRSCSRKCVYTLIRPFVGDNDVVSVIRTTLVHESDGWLATWPAQRLTCGGSATDPIYWNQQEVWILRFIDGGTVAQPNASMLSYTPRCGYGRASLTWQATFANASAQTNNSTPGWSHVPAAESAQPLDLSRGLRRSTHDPSQ
jgi:hypothetical protein